MLQKEPTEETAMDGRPPPTVHPHRRGPSGQFFCHHLQKAALLNPMVSSPSKGEAMDGRSDHIYSWCHFVEYLPHSALRFMIIYPLDSDTSMFKLPSFKILGMGGIQRFWRKIRNKRVIQNDVKRTALSTWGLLNKWTYIYIYFFYLVKTQNIVYYIHRDLNWNLFYHFCSFKNVLAVARLIKGNLILLW